jgi:potassium voltage-gated channel Eag-related subfamily H protein 8
LNFKSKEFGVIQSPVIVVRIAKIVGCGLQDIRYQFLKHLPESSLQAVLDLMNGIWEAGDRPSIWKLANVIPIPISKPGNDHSEPSHYRPIALTNCVCKTIERRINARQAFLNPMEYCPIYSVDSDKVEAL